MRKMEYLKDTSKKKSEDNFCGHLLDNNGNEIIKSDSNLDIDYQFLSDLEENLENNIPENEKNIKKSG